MSRGVDRTYGCVRRRDTSASDTVAMSVPAATPMSTRVTAASPNTAWAVCSGTTTVRPKVPFSGPSPARIPMTR